MFIVVYFCLKQYFLGCCLRQKHTTINIYPTTPTKNYNNNVTLAQPSDGSAQLNHQFEDDKLY